MRRLIRCFVVAGALARALGAQGTVPGWVVEFKSVLRTLDASHPAPPQEWHDRWIVADGRVRIEPGTANGSGGYAIFDGRSHTLRAIDVGREVVDELSINSPTLSALAGEWQLRVLGDVRRTDMGEGPRILGHRTRHIRLTSVPCERFYLAAGKKMLDTITLDLLQARDVPALEAMRDPQRLFRAMMSMQAVDGVTLRSEWSTPAARGPARVLTREVTRITPLRTRSADVELPVGYPALRETGDRNYREPLPAVLRAAGWDAYGETLCVPQNIPDVIPDLPRAPAVKKPGKTR